MNFKEVENLIERHRGEALNLGDKSSAPSLASIAESEAIIGRRLPDSYKWFVTHYRGGEIGHDEVFSIYENKEIPSGEIAYQYKTLLKHKLIEENEIPIMMTGFGEIFVFDSTVQNSGEYPVIRKTDSNEPFAENYLDFLQKIIALYFERRDRI